MMTIPHQSIQDGLYDWITTVAPELSKVYAKNQEAPQPLIPYATFWIKSVSQMGIDTESTDYDSTRAAGAEVCTTRTGPREVCVYIDVYTNTKDVAKDALTIGERLTDSLRTEVVSSLLRVAGLTFLRRDFSKQLSGLESTVWISRYYAELVFCAQATTEEFSGYIGTVETFGTVQVESEEISIDGEITLP